MTVLEIFGLGHGILFVALHAVLVLGVFLEWRRDRQIWQERHSCQATSGAAVSLVIPIHNESRRMAGLLKSLLEQDHPAEIIFVDDRSDDESPAMLAAFVREAAGRGMDGCRVITLAENPGPNYKQQALSAGIAEAQGDYLLFTDGDCEMPPGWIRAMARRMGDKTVGAVVGPVFKKKQGRGFLSLYQCFDHVVRYVYLAGSTGLGAAGGGFGNNLIVRRAALDAIGGYDAVPSSPTEDAALISQIRVQSTYHVRAIALPDAAVLTAAEEGWRGFIGQTLRWNNGGLFSPEPMTRLSFNFLALMISLGILAIPLLPLFPCLWPMSVAVLVGMIGNTAASFGLFRTMLPPGGPLNLGYLLALLFTPVCFTLLTVMGYCRIKIKWKGKDVV